MAAWKPAVAGVSLVSPQSRPQLVQVVGTVVRLQRHQQPPAVSFAKPQLTAIHVNREANTGGKIQVAQAVQAKRKNRHSCERHLDPGNQQSQTMCPT